MKKIIYCSTGWKAASWPCLGQFEFCIYKALQFVLTVGQVQSKLFAETFFLSSGQGHNVIPYMEALFWGVGPRLDSVVKVNRTASK